MVYAAPVPTRSARSRFVLLGDLVDSRLVSDRYGFKQRLDHTINNLRRSPKPSRVHRLRRVKGIDEIEGVTQHPGDAVDIAWRLNLRIWPERFRFGLAFGETGLDDLRTSTGVGGDGFHHAATALERAKHDRLAIAIHPTTADRTLESVASLIEASFTLADNVAARWTHASHEAVLAAVTSDESHKELASRLHISPQAFSKRLDRAHADHYRRLHRAAASAAGLLTPGSAA